MKTLLFLLLPLFAAGQCDFQQFPIIGGANIYQGGIIRGSLSYTQVNGNYTVTATGFHLRSHLGSGGIYQYNWSISKNGYSWKPLGKTCVPAIQANLEVGDRILLTVWYYDFNEKIGATDTYPDRYPENIEILTIKTYGPIHNKKGSSQRIISSGAFSGFQSKDRFFYDSQTLLPMGSF